MTRTKSTYLALLAVLLTPMAAHADPIQFDYFGSNSTVTYVGSMVIDDLLFNGGSFQALAQSNLLAFSMTATTTTETFSWVLADLIPDSVWFFDSSGAIPDIVGQGGFVSTVNSLIAASTGVMSSSFGTVGDSDGDWTFGGRVSVPEPSTLALLGIGLLGMGLARRRRMV